MNEAESRRAMYYPKRTESRGVQVATAVAGIMLVLLIVAVRIWR